MNTSLDRLYELLPVVYRQRDAAQGEPLRALLRVIAEQVNVVEADIAQLYENWFIETCQDWVVPYIGDLISYQPVHEAGEPGNVTTVRDLQRNKILIPRREVANTIRYRRRKGTLALLELLANDVAGWPARAVEFYTLIGWTQALNHQRPSRGRTVDVRSGDALDHLDGPFDALAHSVDIRRIASHRTVGRYNIPSVGLFVWRLKWYSVTNSPAYCLEEIGPQFYTFSVLGNNVPLYNHPQPETEPTHIAEELNLPTPIRRRAFEEREIVAGRVERTQASDAYYGICKSLLIWANDWPTEGGGQPIPRDAIIPADLSNWWQYRAPRNRVAVDPVLGRIAFPPSQLPRKHVRVSYYYGSSADIGGGEYERSIPQLSLLAISLFRTDHLKDPTGLVKALRDALNPLSQYLRAQCSPAVQQLLDEYADPGPPSEALLKALIDELNRRIHDEGLYDEQRFKHVNLPEEIRQLITQSPQGQQRIRLNRLLLEAAYSQIARSYGFYRVGELEALQCINDALEQWKREQPRHAVIEVADSRVYVEQLKIVLGPYQSLQLRAADQTRPVIRLLDWQTDLPDSLTVSVEPGSRFTLDGLLVTGRSVRIEGVRSEDVTAHVIPTQVIVRHSTLVPGWAVHPDCEPKRPAEPSLELVNLRGRATIEHSIIGSIQVHQNPGQTDPITIHISDSILDATSNEREALGAPGPAIAHAVLTILRSTIFGQIQTHAVDLAENTIFNGLVRVARRQRGCMRFCYVTPGSRTPRRYNCQPDLVERGIEADLRGAALDAKLPEPSQAEIGAAQQRERERVRPQFNSVRYGTPIYCQLAHTCASEITRGADDESEMGVFHDLYQPQRAANLQARLDEYIPAGLDAGIIYAS